MIFRGAFRFLARPVGPVGEPTHGVVQGVKQSIHEVHELRGRREDFADAVARFGLDDAAVRWQYRGFAIQFWSMAPIVGFAFFSAANFRGDLLAVAAVWLVAAAGASILFRAGFRCWQIRHQALRGPGDWLLRTPASEWIPGPLPAGWTLDQPADGEAGPDRFDADAEALLEDQA
ncbi:MAG TPA: hypothetical protein VK979_09585 [Guyparkeria sp.]|nr:hypothetical protein [Guyparkeria sp.]